MKPRREMQEGVQNSNDIVAVCVAKTPLRWVGRLALSLAGAGSAAGGLGTGTVGLAPHPANLGNRV